MAKCKSCEGRLLHTAAQDRRKSGKFYFECADCGRVHSWTKWEKP